MQLYASHFSNWGTMVGKIVENCILKNSGAYFVGVLDNVTICVDITCSGVRIVCSPRSLLLEDKPLHLINYYSGPC